ncbi:asparagine synthase (glutamine-hydrolyzing) [Mangrovihabitans endophyticus]|uniref:asparagine synthase (glutamine-hydrolyzing) n=1 Tax=Mangrovihabitans endophyticus TaxID=1751298 RepID=A0A8J3BW48_9ACTN|nr:asparagine synthase (glutamine-hydrolyzing) [Mangrovihabitans endophyticus]GGK74007.1 asparagine synthetase B [Mangrovihabitans endophyticus]
MCRIHGFLNGDGSARDLPVVAALQHHGGPDGTGSAGGDGWGLGSNRLAVMDVEGGGQPYRLGPHLTVVFNGEIYNHEQLRASLRSRGYQFADRCDGSVLPALYDAYGAEFVDHLDGMYAIAVMDTRGPRPVLLLATDPSGMKPVYHHWDPVARRLHFASELPALLGFAAVPAVRREAGLEEYLAGKAPYGTDTFYAGIEVLPPGALLRCVSGETPVLRRRDDTGPAERDDDLASAGRDLLDLLWTEVGRLLVADVPVAVVTSGGLDSSLVTAIAARQHPPIHSFTVAYRGDWPFDERGYAAEVAERAGTVHHVVEVDPATLPGLAQEVVDHLGQPNADPITLSSYALFAAVREAGFTVALTGDAADEMFGGYARMRAAVDADRAGADWLPDYLDALAVLPAAGRHALYTDEYRRFLGGYRGLPTGAVEALRGQGPVLRRIRDFERLHRLPAYHLRRVDHLSMASSVEVRLPFCQPSVVRCARRKPDHLLIADGQVKRPLYSAARGLVPGSVLGRPKQPFTLPLTAMLTPGAPLWDLVRDALAPQRLRADGRLDPAAVEALFSRQESGKDDEAALALWALTVHAMWSRSRVAMPA